MTRADWMKQVHRIAAGLKGSRAAQEVSLWQPHMKEDEDVTTDPARTARGQHAAEEPV